MNKLLLSMLAGGLILSGCHKSTESLSSKNNPQHENKTNSTTKEEAETIGDEALYSPTEGMAIDSLIQKNIKIGDKAEELKKVAPDQYKPQFDAYSFSLSGDLYGHISNNIIHTLTVRLDSDPISLDEATDIVTSILPDDAELQDTREETPYIFYYYKSENLPSPSKIEVQIGAIGGNVKVIGFTSDIGTTVNYNN